MQDLLAVSFRVQGDDLDATYAGVAAAAARWAWRGPGAPPDFSAEPSGERPEVNGYRLAWSEYAPSGRSERALDIALRHPDPQTEGREWRTVVDIVRTNEDIGITVRLAREAVELRMVPAALTTLRRPGLIPELLNTFACRAGGLDLTGTAATVHVTGVEDFVTDVLRSAMRVLPVIVVAPPVGNLNDPSPAKIADELAGLAHVVTLGGHLAGKRFREAVGETNRVPPGGVRLYWPGFGVGDGELHHRFWTRRSLDADATPIHRALFALLSRVSVHAVPIDPLPAELRRGVSEQRLRELSAAGRSDAELLTLFADENEGLRQRVEILEAATTDQARELAIHKQNWEAAAGAGFVELPDDEEPLEADTSFEPHSWSEFAEYLPVLESESFVLTPRAKEGCNPSPYPDPARMWSHLERLAEAAEAWAAQDCSVGKDLKTWIQENYEGLEIALFDGGLGDRATFDFEGSTYSRQPHVKVDDFKGPDECGRIYFSIATPEKRFIVDHIGLHL